MSDIFVLGRDGELRSLSESEFDVEDVLQELLARYPQLLPGAQLDPEKPRRWLLVTRELGVPDSQDGANRWSSARRSIRKRRSPRPSDRAIRRLSGKR